MTLRIKSLFHYAVCHVLIKRLCMYSSRQTDCRYSLLNRPTPVHHHAVLPVSRGGRTGRLEIFIRLNARFLSAPFSEIQYVKFLTDRLN